MADAKQQNPPDVLRRTANSGNSLKRQVLRKITLVIVLTLVSMMVLSMTAGKPTHLGLRNGELAPLPDRPNAVSTTAIRDSQKLPPIPWLHDVDGAIDAIKSTMDSRPRTKLVEQNGDYLRYEVQSLLFRFVDDVEFVVVPEDSAIQFRSASRVGYSDLGTNRKRMLEITTALEGKSNEQK